MKIAIFIILGLLISLALFTGIGYCAGNSDEDAESAMGRYQLFSTDTTPSIPMLLDTKTGKIWKITADMTGKLKAEGATVEGLAYSTSDADTLSSKVKDINLDNVPDKNKKECKDNINSAFSYALDLEKINKILKNYRAPTQ